MAASEFIGYYTIFGPTGYVVGDTPELALDYLDKLKIRWPNVLHGKPRKSWSDKRFRITVWTRAE